MSARPGCRALTSRRLGLGVTPIRLGLSPIRLGLSPVRWLTPIQFGLVAWLLLLTWSSPAFPGAAADEPQVDPPVRAEPEPPQPPQPPVQAPVPPPTPAGLQDHLIENGVERLEIIPGPETFRDPFSGFVFPNTISITPVDGSRHRLRATGSGGRRKLLFKIYGAVFYADETAYFGPDPLKTLTTEDLARRIVIRFKRDASHERLDGVFQEAIEKLWKGKPGPEVARDVEKLLSFFEAGVRKGETIEFTYLPEKGLYTSVSGVAKPLIPNRELGRRIWEVWLGKNPLSPDLRRDLVRFITAEGEGPRGVERETGSGDEDQ